MRELRTCPVEGHIVLINDAITCEVEPVAASIGLLPLAAASAEVRWQPYEPPWVGIEGSAAITRMPAVARDGLGAHERLSGSLPNVLGLAQERIADLRRDARLQGFALAGTWSNGELPAMDLVALPFESRSSAPARWRDAEIGGPRCLLMDSFAVALLAWAPRTPMECWILPRQGRAGFEADNVRSLAPLTERALRCISAALPGVTIDVVLVEGEPWRLELRPRIRADGLFPIATGIPAHGTFPERALLYLCDFNLEDQSSTP